ncbi:hypothetical protein NM688_g6282 [Phlebia brevispora]|uniref:Uncharacterized protein n=1 Tax=Phlebia brevispora TaxID=194682 RepID=A0ACC1SHM0_9APHY|nr:hypothetical protein NM688_g6282 [Phlebia brevispora]
MTAKSSNDDLNISLEPHLAEALEQLVPLLPENLSYELKPILSKDPLSTQVGTNPANTDAIPLIPYSLLFAISTWTRSPEGDASLKEHDLAPSAYAMITLLAGSRTSPEKKFPPASTPSDQHRDEPSRELNDRRAVTAVLNAMLSVLGAGVAVWWAADRLRWKDEWKVLLALLAAIVVAASEAILVLIWNARRARRSTPTFTLSPRRRSRKLVSEVASGDASPSLHHSEDGKRPRKHKHANWYSNLEHPDTPDYWRSTRARCGWLS